MPLGLPEGADDAASAKELFSKARPPHLDRCPSYDELEQDADFDPDASRYRVNFADGAESRLRFRIVQGCGAKQAEFRTSNRDVPELLSEGAMANAVMTYFEQPHQEIKLSAAARLCFEGLCATFSVACAQRRDGGDVPGAARWGAAPWHLAMLSGSLLVMEIGLGMVRQDPKFEERALEVEEHHVLRAYELLSLLLAQRACWQAQPLEEGSARGHLQEDLLRQRAVSAQPPPVQCPEWAPSHMLLKMHFQRGKRSKHCTRSSNLHLKSQAIPEREQNFCLMAADSIRSRPQPAAI